MWIAVGAGVFVVLILGLFVNAAISGRRRAAAIKEWAFRNGMSYVAGPVDVETVAKLPQDEIPANLIRRNASNVVSGRRGRFDVAVFDLHQTTGTRDTSTRTYTARTIAVLKLPEALPSFRFLAFGDVKPGSFGATMMGVAERLALKIDGGRHGSIIELPGHPTVLLLSKEVEATRALFTSGVIAYFTDHAGYSITTEGTAMQIEKAQTRTVAAVDQLETLITDATAIAQQFHQGF